MTLKRRHITEIDSNWHDFLERIRSEFFHSCFPSPFPLLRAGAMFSGNFRGSFPRLVLLFFDVVPSGPGVITTCCVVVVCGSYSTLTDGRLVKSNQIPVIDGQEKKISFRIFFFTTLVLFRRSQRGVRINTLRFAFKCVFVFMETDSRTPRRLHSFLPKKWKRSKDEES